MIFCKGKVPEELAFMDRKGKTFNGGFWVLNLTTYRNEKYREKQIKWLSLHNKSRPLWRYGTQPLMLLVFYRKWFAVSRWWDLTTMDLGNPENVMRSKILHMNGTPYYKWKPWLKAMPSQKRK